MEPFKCYYCVFKTDSLEELIDHCTTLHEHEILKYRKLVLDDVSGVFKYLTKTYDGIIPHEVKECGKRVVVSGSCCY